MYKQGLLHGCMTCATVQAPPLAWKGHACGLMLSIIFLKLFIIFEQGVLHFYFSPRPTNYVASSLDKTLLGVTEIVFLCARGLQLFNNDLFPVMLG